MLGPRTCSLLIGALLVASPSDADSCDVPLRDVAYQQWPRQRAKVVFLFARETTSPIPARKTAQRFLSTEMSSVNLGWREIDASNHRVLEQYGISRTSGMPAFLLIHHDPISGEPRELWRGADWDADLLRDFYAFESSATLATELARSLAVAIFVPGSDPHENQLRRNVMDAVRPEVVRKMKLDVAIWDVKPSDANLGLLRQVAPGLRPEWPVEPLAAVVFAKGILLRPILRGAEITEERFMELLSVTWSDCSCEVAVQDVGNTLVMPWPRAVDDSYVALVGPGSMPSSQEPPLPENELGSMVLRWFLWAGLGMIVVLVLVGMRLRARGS